MKSLRKGSRARQSGISLVIGLIMLVLMTLMAITVFHQGTAQTVVTGNAQQNARGVAAAQSAIDAVLNSSAFTTNPGTAIPGAIACANGKPNTLCVSSNGDGVKDFTVTITPAPLCIAASPIPAAQLDLAAGANAPDLACLSGTQQDQFGVVGSAPGETLCATSTWEIQAKAEDSVTKTSVSITEGVGVRILTAEVSTFCTI